jgi:hypothetical protein
MKQIPYFMVAIVLMLLVSGAAKAQQVIASSGETLQNTSGTLSFTLGELVIDTKTNSNGILTQGFQQTKITITAINDLYKNDISITVYPNPTTSKVTLNIEKCKPGKYAYVLYNNTGKLLLKENINNNEALISFDPYAPAFYIIKIQCNGKDVKSVKIIKQ